MSNVPESPITAFVRELGDQSTLSSVGVDVRLGAAALLDTTSPRRQIVVYPAVGTYAPPDRERERHTADPVLASVDQGMVAAIWGESIDDAWDLQQRLFQALNTYVAAGGYRFKHEGCLWDETPPDSSNQGEALTIRFRLLLPIQRPSETTVEVESAQSTTALVSPITGDATSGPTIDVP